MTRTFRLAAILVSLLALSISANATTIEIRPNDQSVDLLDQASIDIWFIPDSGVLLGSFDFDLGFDDSILSVFDVAFGTSLDGGFFASIQGDVDLGFGMHNLFEVSLLAPFELPDFQTGGEFLLATITFDTIGTGTSLLEFGGLFLFSDEIGDELGVERVGRIYYRVRQTCFSTRAVNLDAAAVRNGGTCSFSSTSKS